jgi:parvulin-like peptidyl-prolyl isomerase
VKRVIGGTLILALAGSCAAGLLGSERVPAPAPATAAPEIVDRPLLAADMGNDPPVAHVNGKAIPLSQLQKPLMEAYGLEVLLYVVQLDLARQKAQEQHIKYTQADFDAELDRTLKAAFEGAAKEDYPALLEQLLEKKHASRTEFDLVLQTNAIIRKIAEPQVQAQMKDQITDVKLREAFNALYGEKVVVRHIQCANPQEAEQVKARLAAGDKFETLVHTMSRNSLSAPIDGDLPPFSRQTQWWDNDAAKGKVPQGFKDFAFAPGAKVGDYSDTIQADGAYHILKLERRAEPKVVKFEDVKENLRNDLQEQALSQGVVILRNQLAQMARQSLKIDDPILKKQYEDRQEAARKAASAQAEERARQDLMNKIKAANAPGGGAVAPAPIDPKNPSGTPAPGGAGASPATAPPGEQPPATKSAAPANGGSATDAPTTKSK